MMPLAGGSSASCLPNNALRPMQTQTDTTGGFFDRDADGHRAQRILAAPRTTRIARRATRIARREILVARRDRAALGARV
jgi:hypothetical protein